MKTFKNRLPTLMAMVLASMLALTGFCGCTSGNGSGSAADHTEAPTEDPNSPKLLAHWKLQNVEGCFTGSVDDDTVGFRDLTGNGNDLIAKIAGNGDRLDIFSWDNDIDVSGVKFSSALRIDNTKTKSASVDPYDASETSYTGGYTSGKYLETVKGAPLNSFEFPDGFSVEVIFKLSPELDNEYNRYTGIFSRQGVIEDQNEPPFSIALSEWDNDASGALGGNQTWLQLLIMNDYSRLNDEMDEILLSAGTWYHVLVTVSDGKVQVYLNGKLLLDTWTSFSSIYCTDPDYSWEVGVGRKWGGDHSADSKNENAPEGMIRRLFAGSVAEIRVFDRAIGVEESLYATVFVQE